MPNGFHWISSIFRTGGNNNPTDPFVGSNDIQDEDRKSLYTIPEDVSKSRLSFTELMDTQELNNDEKPMYDTPAEESCKTPQDSDSLNCFLGNTYTFAQDSSKLGQPSGEFMTLIEQEPNDDEQMIYDILPEESCKTLLNSKGDSLKCFSGNSCTFANESSKFGPSGECVSLTEKDPQFEEHMIHDTSEKESSETLQNSNNGSFNYFPESIYALAEDSSKLNPPFSEVIAPGDENLVDKQCPFLENSKDGSSKYFAMPLSEKRSKLDVSYQLRNRRLHNTLHRCKICGNRFEDHANLEAHVTICCANTVHSCKLCGKEFKRRTVLLNHLVCRHYEAKPHLCEVCGKAFKTPTKLRKHLAIHSKNRKAKLHICELCKKTFKQKKQLSNHFTLRHQEERPHVCQICGKAFKIQMSLKSHLVSHSEERLHVCKLCGKAFKLQGYLSAHHKNCHTEQRLHLCEKCGKTFKTRCSLKQHLLTHNNPDSHCVKCYKVFKSHKRLSKHVAKCQCAKILQV